MSAKNEDGLCSKCGNELDTTGSPKWCKKCRAAYQREYQQTRQEMNAGHDFHAGAEAMRAAADAWFRQFARSTFTGLEVCHVLAMKIAAVERETD